MRYEILYIILKIINYIILIWFLIIPLIIQLINVFFCWVKKRTYPKSKKNGRVAFLFPVKDEGDIIYSTVKDIFEVSNYPKELIDVYVVAHNCSDNTIEEATKAGAIVLPYIDEDPNHRKAAYPIKYGCEYIMNSDKNYDFILRLDADNHINSEFINLMNDAFQSGVDFARPYEGSLNSTKNFYTKACTLFYCFDSRYGSRVREKLNLGAHVNGSGSMLSLRMLKKCGGYDVSTISDDAEFCFNRLLDGIKGRFVEDAVVYEDMPASFKDTVNRNKRIAAGSKKLFKEKLNKMFFKFFKTGEVSFLEVYFTYIFNYTSAVIPIWLPLFYIYDLLFSYFAGHGYLTLSIISKEYFYYSFINTIISFISIGLILVLIFGILQAVLVVLLDYKKLGAKKRSELLGAAFLFPVFLVFYAATICAGIFSKKVGHNKISRSSGKK